MLQIVQANNLLCPELRARQHWQQQRGENGDDGDDCQQFNQCESSGFRFHPVSTNDGTGSTGWTVFRRPRYKKFCFYFGPHVTQSSRFSVKCQLREGGIARIIRITKNAQTDAAAGKRRVIDVQDFRPVEPDFDGRAARDDFEFGGLPDGEQISLVVGSECGFVPGHFFDDGNEAAPIPRTRRARRSKQDQVAVARVLHADCQSRFPVGCAGGGRIRDVTKILFRRQNAFAAGAMRMNFAARKTPLIVAAFQNGPLFPSRLRGISSEIKRDRDNSRNKKYAQADQRGLSEGGNSNLNGSFT